MTNRRGLLRRAWDNLAIRTLGYYAVLLGAVVVAWQYLPGTQRILSLSGGLVLPDGTGRSDILGATAVAPPGGPLTQMVSAATAMVIAALLSLPVAWLYIMTRRKKVSASRWCTR